MSISLRNRDLLCLSHFPPRLIRSRIKLAANPEAAKCAETAQLRRSGKTIASISRKPVTEIANIRDPMLALGPEAAVAPRGCSGLDLPVTGVRDRIG